jgi:hypothetical protein
MACSSVKVKHTYQGSERDSHGSQPQARMSSSFYKRLSLTVQATGEPCDLSLIPSYSVGTREPSIVNCALGFIKGHGHQPSKVGSF